MYCKSEFMYLLCLILYGERVEKKQEGIILTFQIQNCWLCYTINYYSIRLDCDLLLVFCILCSSVAQL